LARKILLADDSVTAQNMGRKILADAGYEVFTVNNGSAALKKIAELKPDLVILDVYMPGYSGLEVCQRLKESHDSARIPVLLSVGKLEPFKPEEAQRVRAEGYIVKPFEASELLSALSKLEDKVVPRAEPSKPGRFARAIAAAEEVTRASRSQAGEENGWKSRIGFPHQKAEPEEKVADDPAIYNPVNRDLRTVVETPAELAADRAAEQEQKFHQAEPAAQAAEASVDVAALAPAGFPKDVTPEEVAAIAAAAAQIRMLNATIKDEPKPSEAASYPNPESVPALSPEAIHESREENKIESAPSEMPGAGAGQFSNRDDRAEKLQDLPVTMAATPEATMSAHESASRWTAVSVALEGDEATISLDQEMQKVYAAFAAEVSASEAAAAAAAASVNSAAPAEPHLPIAAMSNPELQYVSQPEQVVTADARQTEPTPAAPADAVASFVPAEPVPDSLSASTPQSEADIAPPVTEPVAALEAPAEAARTEDTHAGGSHSEPPQEPQLAAASHEPVAELVNSLVNTAVSNVAMPASQDSQPAQESETALPEAAAPTSPGAPTSQTEPAEEHKAEHQEDSETVKTTAAAWASWRQIRDADDAKTVTAEPPRQEFDVPASVPAESTAAAMAVAAGAEQSVHEAAAAAAESPADIAGIVDSVLADLRPKLMAEISRKMSEKK